MQRKIDNDKPDAVAEECNKMVRMLTEKGASAFKNGCFIESAYTETETPKVEVAPPAPVMPAAVVKE